MGELVVVVPSRERPAAVRALAEAFVQTCTADTTLVVAVDDNDPQLDEYRSLTALGLGYNVGPSRSMGAALNRAAAQNVATRRPFGIAFMGDDHRPVTPGWDTAYLEALHELGTGIVYGDDLLQGEQLPTQCAMTSDIVRALGYMVPPALTHLYMDNFWLTLGRAAGCLRYLPDVVVEHRHPLAGKAEMDAGYERVNAPSMYGRDRAEFARYVSSGTFAADVVKVVDLRGVRV